MKHQSKIHGRLTFPTEDLPKVITGQKTMTRRFINYHKIVHALSPHLATKEVLGYVIIKNKQRKRLSDIDSEELRKEGFADFWEYLAHWRKHVGAFNPQELVYVYEFEFSKEKP